MRFYCLFGLLLTAITVSQAQEILVKDINPLPGTLQNENFSPIPYLECAGFAYFPVRDELGYELWRTDGTSQGTRRVKDVNKGSQGAMGNLLVGGCVNEKLVFTAIDKAHGSELWITDGTEEGTKLLKDILPGQLGPAPKIFENNGDKIAFLVEEITANSRRSDLWESDGTTDGTKFVKTLSTNLNEIFSFGSLYRPERRGQYFYWMSYVQGSGLYKIYQSDGTAAGTTEILSQNQSGVTFAPRIRNLGNEMIFAIGNDQGKDQLRKLNGNTFETVKEFDEDISFLQSYGNKVVFIQNKEMWITDGTANGTIVLTTGVNILAGGENDGKYYWTSKNNVTQEVELFVTDGTVAGTEKIMDVGKSQWLHGTQQLLSTNNKLILPIFDSSTGDEPAVFAGTAESLTLLKDIFPGLKSSLPTQIFQFQDKVLFIARDDVHAFELWTTDGTPEGTQLVKDILDGTDGSDVVNLNVRDNEIMFHARADGVYTDVWKTDGTSDGTKNITNGNQTYSSMIGKLSNNQLIVSNSIIYKYDGQDLAVVRPASTPFLTQSSSNSRSLQIGNKLIFPIRAIDLTNVSQSYGIEYWVTDGTANGTQLLKDINPGRPDGAEWSYGVVLNNIAYFTATSGSGYELWKSDGTTVGTTLIKNILPAGSGYPQDLVAYNNAVYFIGSDATHGRELWKTDGTVAGTVLVSDILAGAQGSDPRLMTVMGTSMYFIAYDTNNGWALWKTNGTAGGTVMVKDVYPTAHEGIIPTSLTAIDGKLYFSANDEVHGEEVWVSDGTTNGTSMIEVVPGVQGSFPSMFTSDGTYVYFKADGRLFVIDNNLPKFISTLDPYEMISFDSWIYLSAPTRAAGAELYKIKYTGKQAQSIQFSTINSKAVDAPSFALQAGATSGLTVTFEALTSNVIVTGTQADPQQPGAAAIKASQAGNGNFFPAEPVIREFCINPEKPTISYSDGYLTTNVEDVSYQWYFNGELIAGAISQDLEAPSLGDYTLKVQVDGCYSEMSEKVTLVVGTMEEIESAIRLYPNPAKETINIELKDITENVRVEVIDLRGHVLAGYSTNGTSVIEHDIKNYEPSLYLVRLTTGKKVVVKKFSRI